MFPQLKIPFQFSKFLTKEQTERMTRRLIEEMCRIVNRTRDLIYVGSSNNITDSPIILPLAVKCKYGIRFVGYWSSCVGGHVPSQKTHSVLCKIS
ncbi:hypothetical protein KPH14_004435 [Odynerus spinipes]|uniref:Uncharacterized protein n=1 Tax=Odynerus spinipes TaxID=1348599 RepID=A0AAD9VVE9_9HYME|nr:hypothetical protein KPH14_004435 [Odynerus spinipes]